MKCLSPEEPDLKSRLCIPAQVSSIALPTELNYDPLITALKMQSSLLVAISSRMT